MVRSSSLKKLTALMVLLMFHEIESSLIIGLDMGSQNFKVSIAKPGAVDIALDESSSRKTRTLLGFDHEDKRYFGDQAASLVS